MPYNDTKHEYKTILLIGGELHNIQVVIDKDEHEYEVVVTNTSAWEKKLYKQSNFNQFEFLLQE